MRKISGLFFSGLSAAAVLVAAMAEDATTAWQNGKFQVDVAGVIGRSSIVLAKPNVEPGQAMPLGNGRLGAAVWSAEGLTVQLNRNDTLPDRLAPGEVVVPGLTALTHAADYAGRLDLYSGEFREQGGGLAATVYVQPATDALVIDVTGAKGGAQQTAILRLWTPRTPKAKVVGRIGWLEQGWTDDKNPGASGRTFGSLAAITVDGRDVRSVATDPLTITVTFKPFDDGHFRIVAAAPHFNGKADAQTAFRPALAAEGAAAHRIWWHNFWARAAAIRITSPDGSGEFLENLRNIYLFAAAAEKGFEYPGSQAGVADMLSSARDAHHWDSSAFWHWNLRMQVAANIGAGVNDLNQPYFNLYRENLPAIEKWTRTYMAGRPGACIPETMRFNGQGIEYESSWDTTTVPGKIGRDCDLSFPPYYNARTLTTGAEVSLWIWNQYLATNDHKFLADNYPVMASSARFLLSYQKSGPDGLLHTSPSNSHETQWDVTDPTTDIAAAMALYPAVIRAAKLLDRDSDLAGQLQAVLPKIPPLPRTQLTPPFKLLPPSADAAGADMIAESYLAGASNHNAENIGLEPVWPYDLIGDTSPLFDLAKRTYEHRLFTFGSGWSFDPLQAARLGMGEEVKAALIKSAELSARCINGFTGCEHTGPDARDEFYVEESGVVADTIQEALVQDYDGLIRIAPAVPSNWDIDGSVFVRGKTKVDVQVRSGVVTTVAFEPGFAGTIRFRNPWPAVKLDVISGKTKKTIVNGVTGPIVTFAAEPGTSYLLKRHGEPMAHRRFEPITGTEAISAKKLGPVQLGLFR